MKPGFVDGDNEECTNYHILYSRINENEKRNNKTKSKVKKIGSKNHTWRRSTSAHLEIESEERLASTLSQNVYTRKADKTFYTDWIGQIWVKKNNV